MKHTQFDLMISWGGTSFAVVMAATQWTAAVALLSAALTCIYTGLRIYDWIKKHLRR